MTTVAGVFRSRERAQRAASDLRQAGVRNINVLAPGAVSQADAVPTMETEQPGMGKAVGGVVGGALGIAGGLEIGTAAATLVVPGVGPVLVAGVAAAALLGAGGAVGGTVVGGTLEEESTTGLPASKIVTLTLSTGTGPLLGTASLDIGTAAGNAVGTFTNLEIDSAGTNKQLTATASGFTKQITLSVVSGPNRLR